MTTLPEHYHLTVQPLPLRDGTVMPPSCAVFWDAGKASLSDGERTVQISARGAARALGIEEPDVEQLGRWVIDSVCESVLGETVEPDGVDQYGSPSWLRAFSIM